MKALKPILGLALALLLAAGSGAAGLKIRYAKGFSADLRQDCTLVHILKPWDGSTQVYDYALVPRGQAVPKGLPPEAQVVEVPVRCVVLGSGTYAPFLEMLGLSDKVCGLANGDLVFTPSIAGRFKAGKIAELSLGPAESGAWDLEQMARLKPDLILTYGSGNPKVDLHPKLMELGFKVALDGDYLEATPLGRVEWIKFIALFFGREAQAEKEFDRIEAGYKALAVKAGHPKKRPGVILNADFHGIWYMPGRQNYMVQLLQDAGADYLWRGSQERVLPLGTEAVLAKGGQADFIINPGSYRSLQAMAKDEPRYGFFRAFKAGDVYSATIDANAAGAYDFWERGLARPQEILADLIGIFHPEILQGRALKWYRRLPAQDEPAAGARP